MTLYFAYGSNLVVARLRARVPSAVPRGRARLEGYELALDKRGSDGSAKANVRRRADGVVWGALYGFEAQHWGALDACERGYDRIDVEVVAEPGGPVAAQTYAARVLTADCVPFDWYKRLIVEGAREHDLPDAYRAALARLPERPASAAPGRPGRPGT